MFICMYTYVFFFSPLMQMLLSVRPPHQHGCIITSASAPHLARKLPTSDLILSIPNFAKNGCASMLH